MPNLISGSLDYTRIDQSRLIPSKMSGSDAKYLSFVLIPMRAPDEHGNDYIVKQSVSKADRDAGLDSPIIGKAKVFKREGGGIAVPTSQALPRRSGGPSVKHTMPPERDNDGDTPF